MMPIIREESEMCNEIIVSKLQILTSSDKYPDLLSTHGSIMDHSWIIYKPLVDHPWIISIAIHDLCTHADRGPIPVQFADVAATTAHNERSFPTHRVVPSTSAMQFMVAAQPRRSRVKFVDESGC